MSKEEFYELFNLLPTEAQEELIENWLELIDADSLE